VRVSLEKCIDAAYKACVKRAGRVGIPDARRIAKAVLDEAGMPYVD